MVKLSDEVKDAIVREVYLHFQVHRSKSNWFSSEPNWESIGEDEQGWWKEFIAMILKKVTLENRALKVNKAE